MGWLSFFSGKSAEEIEAKGDAYLENGAFGYAKIEFDKAKTRHIKKPSKDEGFEARIDGKIQAASEGLARGHLQTAVEYVEHSCFDDAENLVALALELTCDPSLQAELKALRETIGHGKGQDLAGVGHAHDVGSGAVASERNTLERADRDKDEPEALFGRDNDGGLPFDEIEETFFALCNTLTEDEQEAYHSYGDDFKAGYVALNEGEFSFAREALQKALVQHHEKGIPTHIPLSLALCCLNMGDLDGCKAYVEEYFTDFPGSDKAAQIMCEAYWAADDVEGARIFLKGFMEKRADMAHGDLLLREMIIPHLLVAENAYRSEAYENAVTYILDLLNRLNGEASPEGGKKTSSKKRPTGKNSSGGGDSNPNREAREMLLRFLARTYQAMGEPQKAMEIYGGLMGQCNSCGQAPDFALSYGFAESSFAAGVRTTNLLELFLKLVQEDPENRGLYYLRVSEIYKAQGHGDEARRFHAMADENQRD